MHWANEYVGIPFKWLGTDRNGCSCWGLICLIVEEIYGKTLPRHDSIERQAIKGEADPEPYGFDGWEIPLAEATEGDILHMFSYYKGNRLPLHAGMVVEPGKVLHVQQGSTSVIESYKRPPLCNMIIGAYRFDKCSGD